MEHQINEETRSRLLCVSTATLRITCVTAKPGPGL